MTKIQPGMMVRFTRDADRKEFDVSQVSDGYAKVWPVDPDEDGNVEGRWVPLDELEVSE